MVPENLIKEEFLIPTFIGELLAEGRISVKVLRTNDTWYGMTYKEDVAAVKDSFREMLEKRNLQRRAFLLIYKSFFCIKARPSVNGDNVTIILYRRHIRI